MGRQKLNVYCCWLLDKNIWQRLYEIVGESGLGLTLTLTISHEKKKRKDDLLWYVHQQQQSIVTGIREVWWVGDLQG